VNLITPRHRMFYPRLVRLFYQSLSEKDGDYVFTWDGITYPLSDILISKALEIAHERPMYSCLANYDYDIMKREYVYTNGCGDYPKGLTQQTMLLDKILFCNAWCFGEANRREGEMLEATINVINGHWVSPVSLILSSMKQTAWKAQTTDNIRIFPFPSTIEAIRQVVKHPVFDDERVEKAMAVCGKEWGIQFFMRQGWDSAYVKIAYEQGYEAGRKQKRKSREKNHSEDDTLLLRTITRALILITSSLLRIEEKVCNLTKRLSHAQLKRFRQKAKDDGNALKELRVQLHNVITTVMKNDQDSEESGE